MTAQTLPQTEQAAPESAWPAVRITATHITLLQLAPTARAALVQYRDGSLDVIPDLRAEPAPPGSRVLRHPGRAWADALVAAERDAAEERGHVPPIQTLRKMAGLEATAELAAEARVAALSAVREAAADDLLATADDADAIDLDALVIPADPPVAAVRRGRHVAPRSAATVQAEEQARWAFALQVLEEGDPVAA